jgi:hypothetical protein
MDYWKQTTLHGIVADEGFAAVVGCIAAWADDMSRAGLRSSADDRAGHSFGPEQLRIMGIYLQGALSAVTPD